MYEGICLTDIVLDTGVIIGYGLSFQKAHQHCCRFFEKFPLKSNSYYYPKKVKQELKRVRAKIAKEHKDEVVSRRMHQLIKEFLRDAEVIDYERSKECNWNGILVAVSRAMKEFQQTSISNISFDANHITHYVCFCRERKDCLDHFFITTDTNLYENRRRVQKDVSNALDEQIQITIRSVWRF